MNSHRRPVLARISLSTFLVSLSAAGSFACSDAATWNEEAEETTGVARGALGPAEDAAVQKTMAPIRALETPGSVYMKAVDETFNTVGTFSQVFHVYQPDANGESIRFELSARTGINFQLSPWAMRGSKT